MGSTYFGEEIMDDERVRVQAEIQYCMEKHSSLMSEIDELEKERQDSESMANELQVNVDKIKLKISDYEEELTRTERKHQENVINMAEENQKLVSHIQLMGERIQNFEAETENLKKICSSGMVKKMVFKGNVSNSMGSLSAKHQIKYPVNGGSALITFQKPSVAAQIISTKHHKVTIEDCWIHVKAEAVELSVLDDLYMEMSLSPAKILIYNLPSDLTQEFIMDKLELFFGKSKNGGGEVEKREFLDDCRSAILTFMDKKVVSPLVEKKCFYVPFGEFSHEVHVAPSLEGNLQDYKMKTLECNRTVLITGIPDIQDTDTVRDLLEIHFQKPSNGGGEVQELMYCPDGQHIIALFEDDEDEVTLTE